jgi:FkbM family methyltransferase
MPMTINNDPRDHDGRRVQAALKTLGRHPALRQQVLALLKQAEGQLHGPQAIREDITGPIADALHDDTDTYEKQLADGTRLKFLFRTKIARDFLLAQDEHPTHVWEPQTTRTLLHLAQHMKGDAVVGGAYFGDQAILLARAVQAQGLQVHCFEPNTDQADMLGENVALNRLDNVVVNRCGLWSHSNAHLKLDGFDSFANAVDAQPGDAAAFSTVSIDDYARRTGRTLGLIQIDIEGAELAALQGAQQVLAVHQPHIVFEVHRHYVDWTHGLENTAICRLLREHGYTLYALRDFNSHREMGARAIELIPAEKVYLQGPPHGFNMLAVQDPAVLPAPAFRIIENVSPKLLAHKDPALHHPMEGL